jgi:cellulose biosynthesis protein BcsQ
VSKPYCICVVSAKGGSGKTVLSASIGTMISALGRSVTIVDCDAATNGLTLFYLPKLNDDKARASSRYSVGIFDDAPLSQSPTLISLSEHLSIVPATYVMRPTETVPVEHFKGMLKKLVDTLSRKSESQNGFLILDAQAGTDSFAYAAVEFADEVIIVSEYDPISAEGVERLKIQFGSKFPLGKTWTLYNKLLPDFSSEVGRFLSLASFLPPVSWDVEVIRAFSHRDLAIDLEHGNTYTLSILAIVDTLLHDQLGGIIKSWKERQTATIRQPIVDALAKLDQEIERTERASIELSFELGRLSRRRTLGPILAGGSSVLVAAGATLIALLISRNNSQTYIAVAGTAVGVIGVIVSLFYLRSDPKAIALEATRRSLERTIAELERRRERYQVLRNANIDDLLANRTQL